MRSIGLAVVGAVGLLTSPAASQSESLADACNYELDGMLALDPEAFESPTGGWRDIAARDGCEPAAADLIALYRQAHPNMRQFSQIGLLHHEAQVRASSGDTEHALTLLRELLLIPSDPHMIAYHEAEVAFLERDLSALQAARAKLAAMPEPSNWALAKERVRAQRGDEAAERFVWPLNLDVVDGFINCFDRPYTEAYNQACRPGAAQ